MNNNFNKETLITLSGVSSDKEKYGHKIFRDLINSNYDVVGVNPKGGTILEQEIYSSLEEVPRKTQLLIVVVPPKIGIQVVREAKKLGIENVWLQPGAQSDEIVQYAKANNINLIYNRCFMTDQGIW